MPLFVILALGCGPGVNLAGDWEGVMICGEDEFVTEVGPVEKIGGLFQGAGFIDYGNSNLGNRILSFDLEIEVLKADEFKVDMWDCELEYAGAFEATRCLEVDLSYDGEDALEGTVEGCLLELDRR
ncbi:MAG: hypothetical protein ACI8PZ_002854 [Myxococcota bacterium]|jgi:hypothetical protein